MPSSAANWTSRNARGFVPATDAAVISGTATVSSPSTGVVGISVAESDTLKLGFTLPGVGVSPAELFPPYEQYNSPSSLALNISEITVDYTVSTDALTAISCGLYAISYESGSAVVTTLLESGTNGLSAAVGANSINVPVSGEVPQPNSTVLFVIEVETAAGGTAFLNGVSFANNKQYIP